MKGYMQKRLHGDATIKTERRCTECGKNPPMNRNKLCVRCRVGRDLRTFTYRPRPPQGDE